MVALGFGARLALQPGMLSGAGFDFAGGVLPAGASLTRASAGTRINAAGVLVSEAADVARFEHDPVTLAPRGLLLEPARTNALTQSGAIDSAAWGKSNVVVTADAAPAPDGASAAETIAAAAGGATTRYVFNGTSFTAATWTMSCFARATGAVRYVQLYWGNTANPGSYANFDLVAGQVTAGSAGEGTIAAAGGGWQRIALTSTLAAVTNNAFLAPIDAGTTARLGSATLAAGAGFAAWGAQLEAGAAPSSCIPTSGAAVTRAADVLTLNWASRGAADGTITVRYTFDDGSTQDVATTVAGGTAAVPANLVRARLRGAVRI